MADENRLATFKWFTDTYTRGTWTFDETWSSDIYKTIFNSSSPSPNSNKAINYNDLISPENYNGSISNKENFEDNKGNKKCILQSHIKEVINTRYKFKIGFQKTTLGSGAYDGKDCLFIKVIDIANVDTPPDNKIKIKIIIYDNDNNAKPYNVNIPVSTDDKDYAYIIADNYNIYRVEIVATSVYRSSGNVSNIIQPQIEYYYTYYLVGLISAKGGAEDYDFNGSKITKGDRIDNFVIGGPGSGDDNSGGSGDDSGGSGDSTQNDFVIQDNWVDLETVVGSQSNLKICWAAVVYIINENTILICNDYDLFMEEPVYALLSNSAEIIKCIKSIDNDYNNSDKYIYIAFEELYNSEKYKSEIDGLENYEYADDLPDPLPELELTNFITYGENLIK